MAQIKFLGVVVLALLMAVTVRAEKLVTGMSSDRISITSDFTGTDLVIFGTVRTGKGDAEEISLAHYDVVIVLEGPSEKQIVRKKERAAGIWINRDNVSFASVPSSYLMMATSKPDDDRLQPIFGQLGLGFKHLPLGNALTPDTDDPIADFRSAIVRLREKDGLYHQEQGVRFIGDGLFRARFEIPALVPVGTHKMKSYLIRNGQLIDTVERDVVIEKTGFESFMYTFSRQYGFIYGILCVILAMLTGWLSSVVFRRD